MSPRGLGRPGRPGRFGRFGRAALLAALSTSLVACDRGARAPDPAAPPSLPPSLKSADGGPVPKEPPHVDLDHVAHDFGQVVQWTELRHVFEVSNQGVHTLLLYTEGGPSCAAPTYPPDIAPGGRVKIEVICQPKMKGDFVDTVIVRSSYDKHGVVAEQVGLKLTAKVTAAAAFERELLTVRVPFGTPRTEEVRVVGARADKVRLGKPRIELLAPERPEPGPPKALFKIDPLPAGGGKTAGIAVRVDARTVGAQNGRIVVPTGIPDPPEIDLAFTITVAGTLELSPPDLFFVPGPSPEGMSRVVEVKSAQPGFAVRGVKIDRGPFDAKVERGAAAGQYRVTITLRDVKAPPDATGALGLATIQSNDRADGARKVPLLLYGWHGGHDQHGH